jgi:hypothetical protein
VKDTVNISETYRTKEFVKIKVAGQDFRKSTSQYIVLNSGEWTAYKVNSPVQQKCVISLQVKADHPAEIAFSVNHKSFNLNVNSTEWSEIKLDPQSFQKGENDLKVEVKSGDINLDWINIQL